MISIDDFRTNVMVKILCNTIALILVILFHNTNTIIFNLFYFDHIISQHILFNLQSLLFTFVTIVFSIIINMHYRCFTELDLNNGSQIYYHYQLRVVIMTYTANLTLRRQSCSGWALIFVYLCDGFIWLLTRTIMK